MRRHGSRSFAVLDCAACAAWHRRAPAEEHHPQHYCSHDADIALYLLNHKRGTVTDYEKRFGVSIFIESDVSIGSSHFAIDRGEPVENPVKIESLIQFAAIPVEDEDDEIVPEPIDEDDEEVAATSSQPQESARVMRTAKAVASASVAAAAAIATVSAMPRARRTTRRKAIRTGR